MSLLAVKLGRDARRQWLQFAAVALTLGLGVAVFGAAYDSYHNLETSYREIYQRLDLADVTITGGDSEAIATEARAVPGVEAAVTRHQADVPLQIGGNRLLGRLVGVPPGDAQIDRLLVQAGQSVGDAAPDGVVVEQHTADHFHLQVGDAVDVYDGAAWSSLLVVGVAVSPEYLWPARDRQDLLTSPDDFGVLFGADALVTRVAAGASSSQALVRYRPDADRLSLDDRIGDVARGHDAGDVQRRADQPSNAALQQDIDGFRELSLLFPSLFLIAAGLAAYVLLGRLVRAQRGEIGMLAANGYPPRRLRRHYRAFGAAAGLVGSTVGAVGGVGLAVVLTRTYTSSLDIPLAVARFHPLTPLVGIAIGTVTGLLAAAGPARAATRVTPAEAMRGTAPAGVATRSVIERVPGMRGLPVRVRVALRNVQRSPRRALSTGVGVTLAAVLVLSSLGLLDTVTLLVDEQFHDVQRQDAQLYLAGDEAARAQTADAVAQLPGVLATEPAVDVPVVLASEGHRYQTALTGFDRATTMHHFPDGLPPDGVLLGAGLRGVLHIDRGERITVSVGDRPSAPITVAGFVQEPLGSLAYANRAIAEALGGDAGLHSLLVRYAPGADRVAMREQLAGRPDVLAFRDAHANEQAARQLLGLFYAIVGFMLVFGTLLAFVVLFNTLSVNLSERTVELATLRAAGGRLSTLARMLTGENLALVAVAIPVGLAAGWIVAGWLMASFNSDLFHFALRLRPTTPVVVAAGLLAVTAVTHLPARRHLRRLDVARVVRERAL